MLGPSILIFVMCVLVQLPEIYLLSSFPLLRPLEIRLFYSSVFNIVPLFFPGKIFQEMKIPLVSFILGCFLA